MILVRKIADASFCIYSTARVDLGIEAFIDRYGGGEIYVSLSSRA